MGMFNMGGVKDAKVVSNNFLCAGIHDVIFKGIDKCENYNAIELRFEAVNGEGIHNERIFEPDSNDRIDGPYGPNPSRAEQFMCKIKQIIDALDPALSKKIETDGEKFTANSFEDFIALLKKYLDKRVGTKTQIKLVPTKGNYVGFPGFVARLRDGVIYMTTKVIGDNLLLSSKEKSLIEGANSAKPTNMRSLDNELDDIRSEFDTNDTEKSKDDGLDDDGLPF